MHHGAAALPRHRVAPGARHGCVTLTHPMPCTWVHAAPLPRLYARGRSHGADIPWERKLVLVIVGAVSHFLARLLERTRIWKDADHCRFAHGVGHPALPIAIMLAGVSHHRAGITWCGSFSGRSTTNPRFISQPCQPDILVILAAVLSACFSSGVFARGGKNYSSLDHCAVGLFPDGRSKAFSIYSLIAPCIAILAGQACREIGHESKEQPGRSTCSPDIFLTLPGVHWTMIGLVALSLGATSWQTPSNP